MGPKGPEPRIARSALSVGFRAAHYRLHRFIFVDGARHGGDEAIVFARILRWILLQRSEIARIGERAHQCFKGFRAEGGQGGEIGGARRCFRRLILSFRGNRGGDEFIRFRLCHRDRCGRGGSDLRCGALCFAVAEQSGNQPVAYAVLSLACHGEAQHGGDAAKGPAIKRAACNAGLRADRIGCEAAIDIGEDRHMVERVQRVHDIGKAEACSPFCFLWRAAFKARGTKLGEGGARHIALAIGLAGRKE